MKKWLIILIILLVGCKTSETLLTPHSACESKITWRDESNPKDEYDVCILEQIELLQDAVYCENTCEDHCEMDQMDLQRIYLDFSGCRCVCVVT